MTLMFLIFLMISFVSANIANAAAVGWSEAYVEGGTITAESWHTAVPIPASALLFVSGLLAMAARKS